MSLSGNIKRLRLARGLTQEQLAVSLGVSAQAVSKWETSDTYPDGALLVPLAQRLGVSLDELLDNDDVSMADIARRIVAILGKTPEKDRFHVAFDIGWQIERGLFNGGAGLKKGHHLGDIRGQKYASYILEDNGFTVVANEKEPFFSVFPEPEEGFGAFLEARGEMQGMFAALAREDTMEALICLFRKPRDYIFEGKVLAQTCGMSEEQAEAALNDLARLQAVSKKELAINGEARTLYCSKPSHKLLAMLLMAREVGYKGAHSMQCDIRRKPLIPERS